MTLPQRILVTGGAGFIGSNLVHHLLHTHAKAPWEACCPDHRHYDTLDDQPDLQVLNVDALTYAGHPENLEGVDEHPGYAFEHADVRDADAMDRVIAGFEPEAILHLAAESHVDRSIDDGKVFTETNVVGTQVLLDAARRHDVPNFVHVSTDEVYGSIEEGSFTEDDPLDPSSPYSASKAGSDLLALAHHETYGTPVTVTRCTNNYGPRQHPEKLIPLMITKALRDEELPVYGTGENVRDWLYVKDHAAALETVMVEGTPGEVYNVAGDVELQNIEVVRTILDRLGKPEELITFVEDRPGHDWRYSLDDSKLRRTGWAPRVGFGEGLEEAINYRRP